MSATLPAGPFGCILADPPWLFGSYTEDGGKPSSRIAKHYDMMSTDELCSLPVGNIAAPDCALFMWVVDSHLPNSLRIAKAWGFEYRTIAFVWVKSRAGGWPHIGMGYWSRKQTEPCLLFTRGAPRRLGKGVEQIIHCPRGAHSAKPEQQYGLIELLVGGPYLELFARTTKPGWTAWGNETGKRDASLFTGVAS